MQVEKVVILCLFVACSSSAVSNDANPLAKVISLMDQLKAKIVEEGEAEAKAYDEYVQWCQSAVQDTGFAIETASKEKTELEAKIAEFSSEIDGCGSKVEDLAAAIATNEADLKSATGIRTKEVEDFTKSERELMEVISEIDRAISILEKEMAKNPAAFAQVYNRKVQNVLQSLSLVADAAAFSVTDKERLLALAQTDQGDEEFGAPVAAAYKSQSGGIIDVLEDMKEKAESQLAEMRKAEEAAKHNYEMLKSSLEAQISADTKDMKEEKTSKAEAEEAKAEAEGDLEVTSKELANADETLATAKSTCMKVGADHELTVKARADELKVIAEAKKILVETTKGAEGQTYSFLQVYSSRLQTRADLAHAEVVVLVKRLAREHHSAALAQLASRVAAVLQYGSENGEDPFVKVKGLIQDMIAKLQEEGQAEASEKAYCDEQMAKTEVKKEELDDDLAKLTVKIDQANSKSAKLKEEVQELEGELAALTKLQAEMDKIRQETHADYSTAKADLEQGLNGVRKALGALREYYGGAAAFVQDGNTMAALMQQPSMPESHVKAGGAGQGIINILEVVESDFAENLAKEETQEADAQSSYDKTTQENKISKTLKEQDVKYKTQEIKSLGKSLSELSADRESAYAEHAAVMEYYEKIKERCIAKPETYEERKKRRAAEIVGLKEALSILENETAFMQRKSHRHMRGTLVLH